MNIRKWCLTLLGLFLMIGLQAQILEPVKVSQQLKKLSETEYEIRFNVDIEEGWHIYSTNLGEGGPVSASLTFENTKGVLKVGDLTFKGHEIAAYDKLFGMDVRYFEIGRAHV